MPIEPIAEAPASAAENLRPHCKRVTACQAKGRGTHCRACNAASPAGRAQRARTMKVTAARCWADPVTRARMVAATTSRNSVQSPECQRLAQTEEAKARRIIGRRRTIYAWCPDEFYPLYRELIDRKGISPSEAKRMTLIEIEQAPRRAKATIARITAEMHAKAAREKAQAY